MDLDGDVDTLGLAVVVLTAAFVLAGEAVVVAAADVLDLETVVAVVVVLAEPVGRVVPVVGFPDEGRVVATLAVALVAREEAVAVLVEEAGDFGAEALEAAVLVAGLAVAPGRGAADEVAFFLSSSCLFFSSSFFFSAMASRFWASLAFLSSSLFFFSASCCSLSFFALSCFSSLAAFAAAELPLAVFDVVLDAPAFEAAAPGFLAVAPAEPVDQHRFVKLQVAHEPSPTLTKVLATTLPALF